jgi:hypothetical protein
MPACLRSGAAGQVLAARSGHRSELLHEHSATSGEEAIPRDYPELPELTEPSELSAAHAGREGRDRFLWRSGHRQLHDRGGIPNAPSPARAFYFRRGAGRVVKAPRRSRPGPVYALRFQHPAIQLVGNRREGRLQLPLQMPTTPTTGPQLMPLPSSAFKSASIYLEISSKSFGRIWSEGCTVAKDEIHEDEISEVDERRHRTNCRFWRATLRKQS